MRADRDVMNSIRPYHQLAQSHGTTLARALDNYWGMEQYLRGAPLPALERLVYNMNLRTQDNRQITFRDLAWHYINQTPEQLQAAQTQTAQVAQSHQIAQIRHQQAALAQNQARAQYQLGFAHTRREVDRFAETHPRLDELIPAIKRELMFGFDLPTA